MCGFTDVREDSNGCYCSVCGQRFRPGWLAQVEASMSKREWDAVNKERLRKATQQRSDQS